MTDSTTTDAELTTDAAEAEGQPGDAGADLSALELTVGAPFAMSSDVALESATAVVQDEHGRPFRIDLLSDRFKSNPHDDAGDGATRYTHLLIVCPEDDAEILAGAIAHVLAQNGIDVEQLPELDAGDAGDDE